MYKLTLFTIMCTIVPLTACSSDLSPTEENCRIGYINEVAQKQGLEKASNLSEACIKKGYDSSVDWLKDRKDQATDFVRTVKDKSIEVKDKVVEFSNNTIEEGKKLLQ